MNNRIFIKLFTFIFMLSGFFALYCPELVETAAVASVPKDELVGDTMAPRGGLIEIDFILRNRLNGIVEALQPIQEAHDEGELLMSEMFNGGKPRAGKEHDMFKATLIKGMYADYASQLLKYKHSIEEAIARVEPLEGVTKQDAAHLVQKGNLIRDLIEQQTALLDLVFLIDKQERSIAYQKHLKETRQKSLDAIKADEKQKPKAASLERLIVQNDKDIEAIMKEIGALTERAESAKSEIGKLSTELQKLDPRFDAQWFINRLALMQNQLRKTM